MGPESQCLGITTGRLDRGGDKEMNKVGRKLSKLMTVSVTCGINEVLLL